MYWFVLFLLVLVLPITLYLYVHWRLSHWTRKGVPQRTAFGQIVILVRSALRLDVHADVIKSLYDEFPNSRYVGGYHVLTPVLYICSPDLIKQLTVKDFDFFLDHSQFISEEMDPLWGKNVFALKGDRWRDMRSTLSPAFTSSKIKSMYNLMSDCAQQLMDFLKQEKKSHVLEIKDVMTRYASDITASVAFGITVDSLKHRNNEFFRMGKEATTNFRRRDLKFMLIKFSPTIAKFVGLKKFPSEVSGFFRQLVKSNIASREKTGIIRHDMIHLLMEARKGKLKHEDQPEENGFTPIEKYTLSKEEKRPTRQLTDDDLAAQALIFFFAGVEGVSTLMSFLLYELAINPDIQETLRQEVDEAAQNAEETVTYDTLMKLKYMDAIVFETLRKWPTTGAVVDRRCSKPYTIQPIKEGETPVHIKTGDILWIPLFPTHRNSKFYPDPMRFDPERFNETNRSSILPYTYLPFGAGPRSCLGNRFTMTEAKTVLFHIIRNFDVLVSEKTSIPFRPAKDQFHMASENGFWLELRSREA